MMLVLGGLGMNRRSIHVGTARLGALALLTAVAVVPAVTKVGPVVLDAGTGIGLHALDAVVMVIAVPLAIALLRYAEMLGEDDPSGGRTRCSISWPTGGRVTWSRWLLSKTDDGTDTSLVLPDQLTFGAVISFGAIGLVLALTDAHPALVPLGSLFVGGAITFVAAHLYYVRAANNLAAEVVRLQHTINEISLRLDDSEQPSFDRTTEDEATEPEIRIQKKDALSHRRPHPESRHAVPPSKS